MGNGAAYDLRNSIAFVICPRAAGALAAAVELAPPDLVLGGEFFFPSVVGDEENQKEGMIVFKSIVQS